MVSSTPDVDSCALYRAVNHRPHLQSYGMCRIFLAPDCEPPPRYPVFPRTKISTVPFLSSGCVASFRPVFRWSLNEITLVLGGLSLQSLAFAHSLSPSTDAIPRIQDASVEGSTLTCTCARTLNYSPDNVPS